ncbi:hypothetical protein TNCT_579871 [Trichonephila clavata]|uniref:Uncharacterized protein n=1 Tax=Trichonephila clavata TaxID=2740835 RepID=A0A8X6LEI1_TRICU|nr:hypothetical protein TNCT_579871 [Trichonephila clavata]
MKLNKWSSNCKDMLQKLPYEAQNRMKKSKNSRIDMRSMIFSNFQLAIQPTIQTDKEVNLITHCSNLRSNGLLGPVIGTQIIHEKLFG